jgi:mono/diheme cytochrome c family protein
MSGCHDEGSHREGIVLTDYYSIINSDVLKPGHPNSSKLVEVLTASGESMMPPNPYSALTTAQINSIRTWIDQGAKFNNCVGCDTLNYTFAANIWPILNTNCTGCHNNNNPGGNIYIRNYADVQAMVIDGSLMGSLLGDGYALMPKNSSGLQSCKITQIQKWINDGALNN